MERPSRTGSTWLAVSGRELMVLALAAGVALGAVALVRAARFIWRSDRLDVSEAGELVVPPARININTAADYELEMLPGIGPATARAIIEYRNEHGFFESLEDLQKVRHIGPKTIEGIRSDAMCTPPRGNSD